MIFIFILSSFCLTFLHSPCFLYLIMSEYHHAVASAVEKNECFNCLGITKARNWWPAWYRSCLCAKMTIKIRKMPSLLWCVSNRELLETTCRLANTLKSHGIQKGDRVAIYMPVSPLAVAALLACARIGAVHMVVFAGFSSEALAGRIQDGKFRF